MLSVYLRHFHGDRWAHQDMNGEGDLEGEVWYKETAKLHVLAVSSETAI